ncbi:putative DNA modification/repair radical SAM protein [Clostridia bacterium]|nr:putative DNA modification/repair radical SAM protein [Clostridia bacterium]
MTLEERISILTRGAKYDISCSSSGVGRKNAGGQLGNTKDCGICHSFTADGRCISILKLLMTNNCAFDCLYCLNRRSAIVPRASLTPQEICELVIGFYKRNYIEGLFLSSAVERSPDRTMELLTETVVMLRKLYGFNGYIHLKAIPHADPALIQRAARYADRMSVNIELPSERSLKLLAPQKTKESIVRPMRLLARSYLEEKESKRFTMIPAGQTTQMIIGASPDADGTIMRLTQNLYRIYRLKRVYYSAFMPVGNPTSLLPAVPASLLREHRLYQADWLLRFYGFDIEELLPPGANLAEDVDPKSAWAVCHPDKFPVEINSATHEQLMRVPGIGATAAWRIVHARRYGTLDFEDLRRMRVVLKRARHFVTCRGKYEGLKNREPELLRAALRLPGAGPLPNGRLPGRSGGAQIGMFEALSNTETTETGLSVLTGQF